MPLGSESMKSLMFISEILMVGVNVFAWIQMVTVHMVIGNKHKIAMCIQNGHTTNKTAQQGANKHTKIVSLESRMHDAPAVSKCG